MNFRRVDIHRLGRLMKATGFLADPCFHEVKENTWGELASHAQKKTCHKERKIFKILANLSTSRYRFWPEL